MVSICGDAGIRTVVDVAHSIGQELLKTSVMDLEGEQTFSMVSEFAFSGSVLGEIKLTAEPRRFFHHTILLEWNTYAAPFYHNGKW